MTCALYCLLKQDKNNDRDGGGCDDADEDDEGDDDKDKTNKKVKTFKGIVIVCTITRMTNT